MRPLGKIFWSHCRCLLLLYHWWPNVYNMVLYLEAAYLFWARCSMQQSKLLQSSGSIRSRFRMRSEVPCPRSVWSWPRFRCSRRSTSRSIWQPVRTPPLCRRRDRLCCRSADKAGCHERRLSVPSDLCTRQTSHVAFPLRPFTASYGRNVPSTARNGRRRSWRPSTAVDRDRTCANAGDGLKKSSTEHAVDGHSTRSILDFFYRTTLC